MGDAPPPSDLEELGKWIPTSGFDLYVIGTQECEYKPKGMEDPENTTGCEADWFGRIQSLLGTEYIRVCFLPYTRSSVLITWFLGLRTFIDEYTLDCFGT